MKNIKIIVFTILMNGSLLQAQQGIGTPTPQATFHVNGSLQVTSNLQLGGTTNTKGSSGVAGQVLKSNGPNQAPSWGDLAEAGVPNMTGTVIAVNGKFIVAQEIMVQMTADYSTPPSVNGIPSVLGNLNHEIIDNYNSYSGQSTTNSFTVTEDGIYQIMMNVQLKATVGNNPVVGVWDNSTDKWVARVNDTFMAATRVNTGPFQTYTLISAVNLMASHTYSFSVSDTSNVIVKHLSSGNTGSGPVTQISVKRLR